MNGIIQITAAMLAAAGNDYHALTKLFEAYQWSTWGFVDLPPHSDMPYLLEGAAHHNMSVYELPQHPDDYKCTVLDLYKSLPKDWSEFALKGEPITDEHGNVVTYFGEKPCDDFLASPALWGNGWFGSIVTGYFGTARGAYFRGVPRSTLETYEERGFSDACRAKCSDLHPRIQWSRSPRGHSAFGHYDVARPIKESGQYSAQVIDPGEKYIWEIEAAAADGDFLAHCELRALFAGVAKFMSSFDEKTVAAIAKNHPVPSLAAFIRIWRHRDSGGESQSGRMFKTMSEQIFASKDFMPLREAEGKKILQNQGGLSLPPHPATRPLVLKIERDVDIDVTMVEDGPIGIDSEVVDIIGLDAAEAAKAEAIERLKEFGITL